MSNSFSQRLRSATAAALARCLDGIARRATRLSEGLRRADAVQPQAAEPDSTGAEVLLEALLNSSPDAIYFKDRQCRFVRFSNALWQLFKMKSPEDLIGKSDADFFTAEHANQAYQDEQEIMRTGKAVIGKLEKENHPDGRLTWALTSKMPWRDKAGNVIGTFGISKNVTELKEAEDRLASERELLRTLLDNIPDTIYFKDRESRFVKASRSTVLRSLEHAPRLRERLAQVPSADPAVRPEAGLLDGLTDFDLFTEEHARPAFEDEQEIMRSGKPIVDKLEKETRPDGSVAWCLTTKMPWRNQAGEIIGTFGISRDITALKEAEAELAAAHKRLLETSRLAGMAEVATDVLHNVGNTLNSVNVSCAVAMDRVRQCNFANLAKIPQLFAQHAGRLDEFLRSDPQGKHVPEYLAAVSRNWEEQKTALLGELDLLRLHVDHVNQIVAVQQNYAKVAGVQELVDVAQLVEDAIQINAAGLERHGVQLRREIRPTTPILLDKHKVLQILINLIRNAKYALSEAPGPDKLLTLRVLEGDNDQVRIEAIDNGIGIAPENLTRIFGHGFTTRRNGHGFGLHSGALAARELGGTLQAHSDGLGRGATFTLTLPRKPAQKV